MQVHRFRDYVAVYVGTGETVYIERETAMALGNALIECADDINEREFINSTFNSWSPDNESNN